ncbi:hypothetical protein HMPREF1230_0864 [Streptococcus pyogenes GA19681]|nr:hypothetical protein HMPREF1230_0864 [Streptococcus pyogenes GA19681]ESA47070.1 hypothetical protein HMPREF1234_1926 [Streptococcus pyogenes GA41039]ESA49289.1 hypothetical protein HMPREF1235_0230 [Streptococcus pyogenes GA41208]ESA50296.1 hypothetical protein HMPREF1233_1595 [Streptococcus pyogenes GA19700]
MTSCKLNYQLFLVMNLMKKKVTTQVIAVMGLILVSLKQSMA